MVLSQPAVGCCQLDGSFLYGSASRLKNFSPRNVTHRLPEKGYKPAFSFWVMLAKIIGRVGGDLAKRRSRRVGRIG